MQQITVTEDLNNFLNNFLIILSEATTKRKVRRSPHPYKGGEKRGNKIIIRKIKI